MHLQMMNMSSLGLHAGTSLQPAISPRLQRAVRLLQMSSLEFAQVVRQALDTNPFLEAEEPQAESDPLPGEAPGDVEWTGELAPQSAGPQGEGGGFESLAAHTRLADHLAGQLDVLPLPQRDRVLAWAVAESLDEDGYLRTPLQEVAAGLGLAPVASEEELRIALCRVQALDPAGVGARSVAECLLLQLRQRPASPACVLAQRVVSQHLQALASRDPGALAARIGCTRAQLEAAWAEIRRLDPHPGWRFAAPSVQYLTPDVIVRRQRGQWTASLNPAVMPRVRLHRDYAELFQRLRGAQHGALAEHLQEARWTVRNVAQRFATILGVSRAILRRQHRFLAYGAMAMKPLALREIAQEVGMHESTVSRVTNNKFMATPVGVFELKYFFSRGLATANGGECSPTAIRGLIQELIAAEPPQQPLSDVALAQALAQQGLPVARRTVTKYRQQLKIEAAERRRPLAG